MLQFLAIDTHGPLVALCDAHLMAAALHILARVLGGVHGCEHKTTTLRIQVSITAEVFSIFVATRRETRRFKTFFYSSFDTEHVFMRLMENSTKSKAKQLFYVLHNQVLHIHIV